MRRSMARVESSGRREAPSATERRSSTGPTAGPSAAPAGQRGQAHRPRHALERRSRQPEAAASTPICPAVTVVARSGLAAPPAATCPNRAESGTARRRPRSRRRPSPSPPCGRLALRRIDHVVGEHRLRPGALASHRGRASGHRRPTARRAAARVHARILHGATLRVRVGHRTSPGSARSEDPRLVGGHHSPAAPPATSNRLQPRGSTPRRLPRGRCERLRMTRSGRTR